MVYLAIVTTCAVVALAFVAAALYEIAEAVRDARKPEEKWPPFRDFSDGGTKNDKEEFWRWIRESRWKRTRR